MIGTGTQVDAVVKLGGSLLRQPEQFQPMLDAVADAAARRRLLIVPGGGPFADAVRVVDASIGLADSAAHWMAVLAMDQMAYLLASRIRRGVVVHDERQIGAAIRASRVAVLAVSRWLQDADPLPHSWTVTSDSIAAWAAGQLGARRLVLVKPPGSASGDAAVDGYFAKARAATVSYGILTADQPALLEHALDATDDG
jgi:aspartokinase-like uncharacterized kinase